jgi:hypothetical protein
MVTNSGDEPSSPPKAKRAKVMVASPLNVPAHEGY